jgi:hypothetical protein
MSFNYGTSSRHRTSGKHFKLFSDELPRIEFDKASFDEFNNDTIERRHSKGTRRSFRDSNHDRMSLPSLGTPEWDGLSDTEKSRPQSYSPFNPLNPNFAKIHKKIQRRHTLKETKPHDPNTKYSEKFRLRQNDNVDKDQYTNAWHAKVRKSKAEQDHNKTQIFDNDNGNVDELNTSNESVSKLIVDKPPVPKKKSLFKELLDASAKENTRINRIKEGLKFNERRVHRHHSLKPHRLSALNPDKLDDNKDVDTRDDLIVPEIISDTSESTKPGILKHGVRVRESNVLKASSKREIPVKPRLIHQDDLPFVKEEINGIKSPDDEVKFSVYADTPMNRLGDMMFVPLPSNKPKDKQKKVNFHDHVDIKERTAMSELMEDDIENHNDSLTVSNEKAIDSDKENLSTEQTKKGVQIRRRTNVRNKEIAKPRIKHVVTINHKQSIPDKQVQYNERFVHTSKPMKYDHSQLDNEKLHHSDSIISSSKSMAVNGKELKSKPLWKAAKPAVAEVLIHASDPVDIIANANSPIQSAEDDKSTANHKETQETVQNGHISLLNFPDTSIVFNKDRFKRSPPRSPPKSPDIDSLSEYTAFFDEDLNFDDFSEEIDRSMSGEDLIKAYRLWDRKRKAFPGGLRKIESPADRNDLVFPKQYGNVRTYKISNPRLDKPPIAPSHSKSSQNNVLMDWV